MECKHMHSLNNIKLVNDEFLNGFGRYVYICLEGPRKTVKKPELY